MVLQSWANTRGRDKCQTDNKDEAKKTPIGVNPLWAGKAEQCSPGTAVLGSGERQRWLCLQRAQAIALALGTGWAGTTVCPLHVVTLFFIVPLLFCEIRRDKWKDIVKE